MSPGTEVIQKRAPTLYGIIVFKVAKGTLFLLAGIALYCLSDNNLPEDYKNFLNQPTVQRVLNVLRVHPGNKFL